MENTKEQLEKEVAQRHMDTMDKKADVMGAEVKETVSDFIAKSTIKAADKEHRRKLNFNIGKYNAVVPQGKQQFTDVHLVRERAKNIKWRAIETLQNDATTARFMPVSPPRC